MSTAEFTDETMRSIDLDILKKLGAEIVSTIQGLAYLFGKPSYAGELTFHFGAERPHSSPKLAGRVRGTHVLSVRGSAWLLEPATASFGIYCGVRPVSNAPVAGKPFNVTALESGAYIRQGAVVERVLLSLVPPLLSIGLRIELDDGSRLTVLPTPPESNGDDLPEPADWELLTPEALIRVGPGLAYTVERFEAGC